MSASPVVLFEPDPTRKSCARCPDAADIFDHLCIQCRAAERRWNPMPAPPTTDADRIVSEMRVSKSLDAEPRPICQWAGDDGFGCALESLTECCGGALCREHASEHRRINTGDQRSLGYWFAKGCEMARGELERREGVEAGTRRASPHEYAVARALRRGVPIPEEPKP